MSDWGGGSSSGGGSQTTIMVVVAMCCFSSLASGLFLWWGYNNQSKVPWLDFFFNLFGGGGDDTGGYVDPVVDTTVVDTTVVDTTVVDTTAVDTTVVDTTVVDTTVVTLPAVVPPTPDVKAANCPRSTGTKRCKADTSKCKGQKGNICAESCKNFTNAKLPTCQKIDKVYYKRKKSTSGSTKGCYVWDNQKWNSGCTKKKSGFVPMPANELIHPV